MVAVSHFIAFHFIPFLSTALDQNRGIPQSFVANRISLALQKRL
jgi:hypothetical protein